jgi:D-alanine--poly(phosphoribitol) ligase subunit 2
MSTTGVSELDSVVREIKAVFRERLAITIASADQDLFRSGILDSATMVRLLLSLEDRFGLSIPLTEVGADSFRTVTRIAELVLERQRDPSTRAAEPEPVIEDPAVKAIVCLFLEKMDIQIESVDADLFHTGVFDSMTLVSFLLHVEERFRIRFPMEELDIEAGVTVATLADLVKRGKRESAERIV